ncbi:phage tail assembly chaperone [uncultured Litoreibacter sp.]|uniref:phage tail assembly chaperone n=1 Tax=uncultured Litoreibacter sp. TaxID=1392394 RepID=UPI0026355CE7|nr:phage tail assembly chaperone [uncultured Litoreibacter sp.]
MNGFDWAALLKAGVQGAGLRPAQFWALTPYELSVMLGVDGAEAPLTRARLMELDALYGGRDDGCV